MTTRTSAMIIHPDPVSRGSSEPIRSDVVQRIQAEYVDMPGLKLTLPQAARLFGVNTHESQRVLSELTEGGFLRRDQNGAYVRRPCPRCS
jgi:Fic family protein